MLTIQTFIIFNNVLANNITQQNFIRRILFSINNLFLMRAMLYWHWVYLGKIANVILTFSPTLSLTNFNFKIEHANISNGKASNFIVLLSFR